MFLYIYFNVNKRFYTFLFLIVLMFYVMVKIYIHTYIHKKARNHVQSLIKRKKRQYVVGKLEDNVGKPKELWKTLKSLSLSSRPKTASKICLETNKE